MTREEKENIIYQYCENNACCDCGIYAMCNRYREIEHWTDLKIDLALKIINLINNNLLTPDDYVEKAMRTNDGKCGHRVIHAMHTIPRYGELLNGALGLTGEAGEVADLIKKAIFHGHELDKDALKKEMGDVMWYMALLCHALGIQLSTVMAENIKKLERRYKNGFSEEASRNRKE